MYGGHTVERKQLLSVARISRNAWGTARHKAGRSFWPKSIALLPFDLKANKLCIKAA